MEKIDLLWMHIHDLFKILGRQPATRDFSLRATEEPFTEVGHIAQRYNHVLDALHDAVSKTETMIRSAADAIIVFSTDTLRIISANPGASLIFGHPALHLEEMTIPELLPAWGIPATGDNETSLLHAMRSINQVEITGRRANGSAVTLEAVISQSSGRQGDFFIGTFRDISERKRYENELRKAEENFRSIFENAVEGMFRTTPHGRYLQANPALARIYGFENPAELMHHYNDISRQLYVEAGRREEFIRLLGEKEEIFDFESAIRRKDGSVIWISENARAVKDAAGNVACYEGTVMDITQRRAMQQALDRQMALFGQLFEDSPLAIALVDTVGRIVEVNGGFETLLGTGETTSWARTTGSSSCQRSSCPRSTASASASSTARRCSAKRSGGPAGATSSRSTFWDIRYASAARSPTSSGSTRTSPSARSSNAKSPIRPSMTP